MDGDGGQGRYILYGTPLLKEDDVKPRRRGAALDKGTLQRTAPWKQEVYDEEGRRRFHGAFTGGFSAGYYNTVGSKEGWEPQTFSSSRSKRAELQNRTAYDFMDHDEKEELESNQLDTAVDFDTFGTTAAEFARRQAAQEVQKRPSIIPGPIPDEIILPVTQSIGKRLLLKMGWRQGRTIGPRHVAASSDKHRAARKAMLALANNSTAEPSTRKVYTVALPPQKEFGDEENEMDEEINEVHVPHNVPAYVLMPKDDQFGLGFDPYKSASEFREIKRAKEVKLDGSTAKTSLFRPNAEAVGSGFGIGALEEWGEEDEDVYAPGPAVDREVYKKEMENAVSAESGKQPWQDQHQKGSLSMETKDGLPGFRLASIPVYQPEWFAPPVVPDDFVPIHKPVKPHDYFMESDKAPAKVPPPENNEMAKLVDGLAVLVAKSGQALESLTKDKNKDNPLFEFLFEGQGNDYYTWRLWEERKKLIGDGKDLSRNVVRPRPPPLDATKRGEILGEQPLQREQISVMSLIAPEDRIRLQSASTKLVEIGVQKRPFKENPDKQLRFEQFLRDKYLGGLRGTDISGSSQLTEAQRAQEMLEFDNAIHLLQKEHHGVHVVSTSVVSVSSVFENMESRFTSGGIENPGAAVSGGALPDDKEASKSMFPRRVEQPWRPASLLCKRFELLDPYAGKPLPPPKVKSRTETFTMSMTLDTFSSGGKEINELSGVSGLNNESFSESKVQADAKEFESAIEKISEKPVDLYKAIFSDESDEDNEPEQPAQAPVEKVVEAANAALNRLVADDFLESLGKELGLEVPPKIDRRLAVVEVGDRASAVGRAVDAVNSPSDNASKDTNVQVRRAVNDISCDLQFKKQGRSENVNVELEKYRSNNHDNRKSEKSHRHHRQREHKHERRKDKRSKHDGSESDNESKLKEAKRKRTHEGSHRRHKRKKHRSKAKNRSSSSSSSSESDA